MTLRLFGIPNCDTVKKARAFLEARAVLYEFHDFKKQPPMPLLLQRWASAVGWERLLNRQGTTWRRLGDAERESVVDAASACSLMHVAPSLIKRPVVEWPDGSVTVGFEPPDWAARL